MAAGSDPQGCETSASAPMIMDAAMVAEPEVAIAGGRANGVRQVWHAFAGAGVSVPQ